jgi:signal transduction histidine kinase
MRKHRHRLSGRLLLLFVVTALALAVVVRTGFRFAIDSPLHETVTPHLAEYVQHLLTELGDPPTQERAARLAARLPLQIHWLGEHPWSTGGEVPTLRHGRSRTHGLPDGTPFEVRRGRDGLAVFIQRSSGIVVLAPQGFAVADQAPLAVGLTLSGLLLILVLAYHAIRRLFRPIETIQAGVERIGSGDLDYRLSVRRRDELGALADSINIMADDIRQLLEAKRGLLLAISHELRSPLTRARVNAELLPDGSTRQALLADLGELQAMLTELLESERLSGRHSALDRQATDPSILLRELVAESFATDAVRLDLDPPGTWLSLDAPRIRLLARNLLTNALQHTPPGSPPPMLASHVDDAHWQLSVTDQGSGVAPEDLGHLTEPFFRADRSRQRGSGGVGLGLYLSRVIAEAHGGRLEIDSTLGKGTRVTVRIPVADDH